MLCRIYYDQIIWFRFTCPFPFPVSSTKMNRLFCTRCLSKVMYKKDGSQYKTAVIALLKLPVVYSLQLIDLLESLRICSTNTVLRFNMIRYQREYRHSSVQYSNTQIFDRYSVNFPSYLRDYSHVPIGNINKIRIIHQIPQAWICKLDTRKSTWVFLGFCVCSAKVEIVIRVRKVDQKLKRAKTATRVFTRDTEIKRERRSGS